MKSEKYFSRKNFCFLPVFSMPQRHKDAKFHKNLFAIVFFRFQIVSRRDTVFFSVLCGNFLFASKNTVRQSQISAGFFLLTGMRNLQISVNVN